MNFRLAAAGSVLRAETAITAMRQSGMFGSGEQVVGRALRRKSYALNEDTQMFAEETAKVFGVPFELIPFKVSPAEFVIEPIRIASGWRRVVAIDLDRSKLAAIWGAWDKANDVIYLYDEYVAPEAIALPVSADAIKKRGTWIPSLIDMESRGRSNIEGEALVNRFWALDVNVFAPPLDLAAGIDEARHRLAAGRLKVFSTCQSWLSEFRSYRLDEKGKIVDVNDHLVQATALLCQFGPETGISENIGSAIEEDENELDDSGATRNPVTGY